MMHRVTRCCNGDSDERREAVYTHIPMVEWKKRLWMWKARYDTSFATRSSARRVCFKVLSSTVMRREECRRDYKLSKYKILILFTARTARLVDRMTGIRTPFP